jgi:hypothetical protein
VSIRYPPPLIQCKIGRTLVTDSDPIVWSGRALQKVFVDPADAVLHQCIRPLFGARCAPGLTPSHSHRSRRTRRRPLLCPSDAGELVGQRNGEHVVVQSRLRRLDVPSNTDARTLPASAVLGPKLLQLAAEIARQRRLPSRLGTPTDWRAAPPPDHATTFVAARSHHADRGPRRGTSSCRRCRPRRLRS